MRRRLTLVLCSALLSPDPCAQEVNPDQVTPPQRGTPGRGQPVPRQATQPPSPGQAGDPTVPDATLLRVVGPGETAATSVAPPPLAQVTLRALVAAAPDRLSVLVDLGGVQIQVLASASYSVQGRTVRVESVDAKAVVLVDETREERIRLDLGITTPPSAAGRLTRVDLRGVPLEIAARMLADQSGINISVSANAAATPVSLYLSDVEPLVAVRTLCEGHQLWWRRDRDTKVVRIATAEDYHVDTADLQEERTEAFTLNYPNVFDVGRSLRELYGDRVVTQAYAQHDEAVADLAKRLSRFDLFDARQQGFGQIVGGSGYGAGGSAGRSAFGYGGSLGGGYGGGIGSGYGGGYAGGYAGGQGYGGYGGYGGALFGTDQPLGPVRSEPRLEIGQIERLERRLRELESARPGEAQTTDAQRDAVRLRAPIFVTLAPRQNKIVVRTSDVAALEQIRALVRELDVPTALVMLEVRVLSIEDSDGFESFFEYQWADRTTAGELTTGRIAPPPAGALGPGGTGLRTGDLIFQYVDSHFGARMQLLEREGRVRTLATPVLLTANNEVSRLFVGKEVPINRTFVGGQINQNEAGSVTTPGTTGIEFRPVGTTLLMTPSINSDRTVSLQIVQETSNADAVADVLVPSGDGFVSQAVNVVSSQSVSGTIVAKSDLAVAFGGLIETGKSDRTEKVPLLGDIPLLGFLFRREFKDTFRREIVVIVKPYVIGTPAEQIDRTAQVLRSLGVDVHALEHGDAEKRVPGQGVLDAPARPRFRVHGVEPPPTGERR